jgi:hypothetical protein
MDPDADPGGPKTYGSYGSGFGSAKLLSIHSRIAALLYHFNTLTPHAPPPPDSPSLLDYHFVPPLIETNSSLALVCPYSHPPQSHSSPTHPLPLNGAFLFFSSLIGKIPVSDPDIGFPMLLEI